jgi:membrane peptidoglycan carboxypeptidase
MGYAPGADGTIKEMTNVHGIDVTGGSLPATIWRRFMSAALKGTPSSSFKKPQIEGVVMNYGGAEPTAQLAEARPSATASPSTTPGAGEPAGGPGDPATAAPPNGQPGQDPQPSAPVAAPRPSNQPRESPAPEPKPGKTFDDCFPFCEVGD